MRIFKPIGQLQGICQATSVEITNEQRQRFVHDSRPCERLVGAALRVNQVCGDAMWN